MKDHDIRQKKSHYATHFGPEPEDENVKKSRKKVIAAVYKDQLLDQI
jgi:hypothetical protein